MEIAHLVLKNFRSHKKLKVDFGNGTTLITGPNGIGKTNILEAIYILAAGKSHKSRYDRDLINYEQDFCSIHGIVATNEDKYELELQVIKQGENSNTSTKKAKVNKVSKSITGFSGIFNAVIFSPEDINIITGSPSERRRFLDLILSQVDKQYRRELNQYTKVVQQRNKVLEMINKEGRGYKQMDFWNEQLIKLGTTITTKRTEFVTFVNQKIMVMLKKLDKEGTNAEMLYKSSSITQDRLTEYFDREIASKSTLLGPHREDFEVAYNGHNIAEFGSRGQQRTILLSLKLLEIDYIEKIKAERPVLLLDDIFSELDDFHRHTILEVIKGQQTIISSAETENVLGIDFAHVIKL